MDRAISARSNHEPEHDERFIQEDTNIERTEQCAKSLVNPLFLHGKEDQTRRCQVAGSFAEASLTSELKTQRLCDCVLQRKTNMSPTVPLGEHNTKVSHTTKTTY